MAIYGIGAFQNGREDITDWCIENGLAGSDWGLDDKPSVHYMLTNLKVGDLVYLKKAPPKDGLTVIAVGAVADHQIVRNPQGRSGIYRRVRWLWDGREDPSVIGKTGDLDNVRFNTIYEENDPNTAQRIVNLLGD